MNDQLIETQMSTQQKKGKRKRYPSDMSQNGWKRFKLALVEVKSAGKQGGRPAVAMQEVLNAIFYVVKTGCSWRSLPHDFPCWQTVYGYFRTWRLTGVWERMHDRLRGWVRESDGRERQPTAAVLDSQSVKTTDRGGGTATTAPRRSTAASATCWSTPSA